jgi:hypothetical protein
MPHSPIIFRVTTAPAGRPPGLALDAGSPRGVTSSPSVHPFQRTCTHVRAERSAVRPGVLVSAGSRKMVVPTRKIHNANLMNQIGEEVVLGDPRSYVGFVGWPRPRHDIVVEHPARGLGVQRHHPEGRERSQHKGASGATEVGVAPSGAPSGGAHLDVTPRLGRWPPQSPMPQRTLAAPRAGRESRPG